MGDLLFGSLIFIYLFFAPINNMLIKKYFWLSWGLFSGVLIFWLLVPPVLALEPGALLYRTSSQGKIYGLNTDELLESQLGLVAKINSGHVGIYVGQEEGVDYVVEALAGGIVKMPAKYFVNQVETEEFLGAKIPIMADPWTRAKAVALAKFLATQNLAYDFDFQIQKGPASGQWTCVGLTEKVYESAHALSPNSLTALQYDPAYYAVNITPDGYDNFSIYNQRGDVFSSLWEFSKFEKRRDIVFPFPEIIGFNAGKEYRGERYIFLPATQFLQTSLSSVPVDIEISSAFSDGDIRGKTPSALIALRWSLINNPMSTIKSTGDKLVNLVSGLWQKKPGDEVLLVDASLGENSWPSSQLAGGQSIDSSTTSPVVVLGDDNTGSLANQNLVNHNAPPPSNPSVGAASNPSVSSSPSFSPDSSADSSWSYRPPAVPQVISVPPPVNNQVVNSSSLVSPSDNESEIKLLISLVHAAGDDDWLEIFNYSSQPIDLAASGIRLEKTRQAVSPHIVLRFDSDSDALYPGGRIIAPGASYLVVRDDADPSLIALADAVGLRSDFTWGESGYTIYLAKGAVTSDDDPDIIDKVGFGEARFFSGQGPAPTIDEYYALRRKALVTSTVNDLVSGGAHQSLPPVYNSGHNNQDFVLWPLSNQLSTDNYISEEGSGNGSSSNQENQTEDNNQSEDEEEEVEEESEDNNQTDSDSADNQTDNNEEEVEENNDEENNDEENNDQVEEETGDGNQAEEVENIPPSLLISKIHADGLDDWLEIYNYSDEAIDLAASNFRLAKAYQSPNPSILLRFGNDGDALYPGGLIIPPHSSYLVVRDKASEFWLSQADAIALRSEFTWTDSGYTIYLATGPVSDDNDFDIIDKVGFGTAVYYSGQGPASAISESYALRRKALATSTISDLISGGAHEFLEPIYNSGHNNQDFVLWPLSNQLSVDSQSGLFLGYSPPGFSPFISEPVLASPQADHLWHFDECQGEFAVDELTRSSNQPLKMWGLPPWIIDRYGCSRRLHYTQEPLVVELPQLLDGNNLALALLFKSADDYSRFTVRLFGGPEDRQLNVRFFVDLTEFNAGFPGLSGRYYHPGYIVASDWQRLVINFNSQESSQSYWNLEVNGEQKFYSLFSGNLPQYKFLEISNDGNYVWFDEVAVWYRGLSAEERLALATPGILAPPYPISQQLFPSLEYAWLFPEAQGYTTQAAVGDQDLAINFNSLVVNGYQDNALRLLRNDPEINLTLERPLAATDLSLSFWYKNVADPSLGNVKLLLGNDEHDLFGLELNPIQSWYFFNYHHDIFREGQSIPSIPNDDAWHHIALVYDSFLYRLYFYLDGQLAFSRPYLPFGQEVDSLNRLRLFSSGGTADIDELKIWQGALQAAQILHEYQAN